MPEPPFRAFVIFNPASGRGRGQRRIDAYLALLARHLPGFDHGVTDRAGGEADLVRQALNEGHDTVIAVGGDGTWSHVAHAILASGVPNVRLGVLPSGTGNDFGRNLGLDYADPATAVRRVASGSSVRVDVGRVVTPSRRWGDADAMPTPGRHFLNLVGFGFDIAVIDAARGARLLRGELLYKVTALQQLFRFPGLHLTVENDAGFRAGGPHLMVTVSNGRFFGGGFPIAPGATLDDGQLHACLIADASPFTRASLFGAAQKGRHIESDKVRLEAGASFRLTFAEPPRFEVDGDVHVSEGETVEVEILPGALEVLGA
jgi:diacylglycerol kinase (ATP)